MNRAERRYRAYKKAKIRFSIAYCDFGGTPKRWFRSLNKIEQSLRFGECRNRMNATSCRCEYCLGLTNLKYKIADYNLQDEIKYLLETANIIRPKIKYTYKSY